MKKKIAVVDVAAPVKRVRKVIVKEEIAIPEFYSMEEILEDGKCKEIIKSHIADSLVTRAGRNLKRDSFTELKERGNLHLGWLVPEYKLILKKESKETSQIRAFVVDLIEVSIYNTTVYYQNLRIKRNEAIEKAAKKATKTTRKKKEPVKSPISGTPEKG